MKKTVPHILDDTGERMIPEFHKGNLMYAEHITRYLSARPVVIDKVVLDIASGSGYGTKILAGFARKVYGVDVDKEAVKYAKVNFAADNIEYKEGSGTEIPLEDDSVDVVVTFETIEHIEDYEKFISEIKRVLRPDGVVIVSTPNDLEFPEGAHFHVHEFEYNELLRLLRKKFKYIDPYFQATWRYVGIGDEAFFTHEWHKDLETLNLAPLDKTKYLYFYLLCSNKEIDIKLKPLAATGQHHSDREIIASWAEIHKQSDRMQGRIDELYELIAKTNEQKKQIEDAKNKVEKELFVIVNSKSYAVARKLESIKRLGRHDKQ